ncbi:MAG: TRAP transporter substrate-binding protein [Desulfobacterales bacterium]|nr:TRAP transporter substrate-binding protein [Desulfobacterales bacterium]
MDRRDFIKKVGAGAAALGLAAAVDGPPAVHARQRYEWKMVTSWPKNFPGLGAGPFYVARAIEAMSNGRIKITVYSAGELVGALDVFDTVSAGRAEMGHSAPYYWKKKHPAVQFFCTVPFGLNAQETSGWLNYGGGQELWDELYARFNLKGFAAGNTAVQMGGWFNKLVAGVDDFKGLKMRIPGLGGEVLSRIGAETINLPGGKIYAALKSGGIDATEWVGPYNDLAAGFYEVAKYYYWPGWHEPATVIECMVNKKAYEALPLDLQAIVSHAMKAAYNDMLADYASNNNQALVTLVTKHKVQLKRFPDKVLASLGNMSREVVEEVSRYDGLSKRVYDSYNAFRKQSIWWNKIGEEGYGLARSLTFSYG